MQPSSKRSFTEGPILSRLLIMMLAVWVGMITNIAVAFIDIIFLSQLEDLNVLAAMGFATSILFITGSVGVGFSIATGVLVSQALTRENDESAGRWLSAIMVLAFILSTVLCFILWPFLNSLLNALGADTAVASLAMDYLHIVLLSTPAAVLSMVLAASLRSTAAAKASMIASLIVAFVNLALDPLFIFVFEWGLNGAAWATVAARIAGLAVALWIVAVQKNLLRAISPAELLEKLPSINKVAIPALLTNLFTPVGGLIVVYLLAQHGSEAVAGQALIGSISPMLFAVFFSLTGAAGPIIGQNIGANQPERVMQVLKLGTTIIIAYSLAMWVIFALSCQAIINLYQVDGLAAELIRSFCYYQVPLMAGLGILALSNGVFNNLGKAIYSTYFNGSRATIGTLLCCMIGGHYYGAVGVSVGASVTLAMFGLAAGFTALLLYRKHYPSI